MRIISLAKLLRLLTFSAFGLVLLLGVGCSKVAHNEEPMLMSNDFEHLNGWIGDVTSLTRDKAHSGTYSVVVKPGLAQGLGYNNILGQLTSSRPDKIRVSAWVMCTSDQNTTKLVVEIKDPTTSAQVFRSDVDLGKSVQKRNTWQRIEHVMAVPPLVSATSHIMVYMLGTGTGPPTYLDDLALTLVAE